MADPGRRLALIHRLLTDVRDKAGLKIDPQVEAKLTAVFREMPESTLAAWVDAVTLLDPMHPEWLSLVETLTIHETFFYRDRGQSERLRREVIPALVRARRDDGSRTLRLWSAACASGEEAYTLAMMVLEALMPIGGARPAGGGRLIVEPDWRVEILGTDISRQAVRAATEGVYTDQGMSPFRDMPRDLMIHFEVAPIEGGGGRRFKVKDSVKTLCRFRVHNLITGPPPGDGFDLILCRNVMIYFTEPGRARTQGLLHRALKTGGLLGMGPTDSLVEPHLFEALWDKDSVIYRKR